MFSCTAICAAKSLKSVCVRFITTHNVFKEQAAEEILLNDAALLPASVSLIPIKHFGNSFASAFSFWRVDITTVVKHTSQSKNSEARFHKRRNVNGLSTKTNDRDIPRYPFDHADGVPYTLRTLHRRQTRFLHNQSEFPVPIPTANPHGLPYSRHMNQDVQPDGHRGIS